MTTTGWITRVSCVVSLLCGSLMFAQATAPKPTTTAAAPSAHKSTHKKSHKAHQHVKHVTPGKCKDQTTHGNSSDFLPVACPDACHVGTPQPQQSLEIDIDPYIDNGTDPDDVCLRAGDTITYKSASARDFKIKDIESKPGKQADPFMGKVKPSYDSKPNGSGATQTDALGIRNTGVPDNGCYVFRPHIQVDKPGKSDCYDPHIYTDCGDACDVSLSIGYSAQMKSPTMTPQSKKAAARKPKAARNESEVPAGR
jgi:hypothetical protein